MKKISSIFLLITSLFILSCNNKSSSTTPIGIVGEIIVNPYGVTPLSAIYTTESVNTVPITVTVKGLYGEPDIIHTYPAGYGTEFEIHGMFPESQNTIIVNDGGRIISKNVNIANLSVRGTAIQKKYDIEINNLSQEKYPNNPNLYFVGLNTDSYFSFAISENGYTRYISEVEIISKTVVDNNIIKLYTAGAGIYDLMGNRKFSITKSHHDMIKKGNNYIYLSKSQWGVEDRLIEANSSGNIIRDLYFGDLIRNIVNKNADKEEIDILNKIVLDDKNIYNPSGQQKAVDWFHANSLVYDSDTDILYVSGRNLAVLAIDYSKWELIWWMADDNFYNAGSIYGKYLKDLKSLQDYKIKGAGNTDGPKNQHALFLHKNGNLGMFDNQGDEISNPNGSRYVEYKIIGTHGNYTAEKSYEYRDPSLYSQVTSDVDFTGENYQNILITYGYPTGTILEIEKNSQKLLFKLELPYFLYRADKMPLYYDEGRIYSEDCNLKNNSY
ncbi:aryl-sulfate sulfotransferase [Brachyspira intermedia]|uniref:aryl-sulfate sulfotransferase n=1 Tax=Brachyspira intermedia TaxID=84377 RepID=UPI0030067C27